MGAEAWTGLEGMPTLTTFILALGVGVIAITTMFYVGKKAADHVSGRMQEWQLDNDIKDVFDADYYKGAYEYARDNENMDNSI